MQSKKLIKTILLTVCLNLTAMNSQAELISDFDDGTMQGWSEGDPFNNGSFGGVLSVINSSGNPGGYLRATDTVTGGGSLSALAPNLLSGDLTLLGGLTWDVLLPSQAIYSTNVLLEGTGGTFYRSESALLAAQTINSWFTKSINFTTDVGWQLLSGTASFASVVSNTNALYIELETSAGLGIEGGIDNIRIVGNVNTVPAPASLWLFVSGLLGLLCTKKTKHKISIFRSKLKL